MKYLLGSYSDRPTSAIRGYESLHVQRAIRGEHFNVVLSGGLF